MSFDDRIGSVLKDIGIKPPPPPVFCFHCKKKISRAKIKAQRAIKLKEDAMYCSSKCLVSAYGEPYSCLTCNHAVILDGTIRCTHTPTAYSQVNFKLPLVETRVLMQRSLKNSYAKLVIFNGDILSTLGGILEAGFPNNFAPELVLACGNHDNFMLKLPNGVPQGNLFDNIIDDTAYRYRFEPNNFRGIGLSIKMPPGEKTTHDETH
jgi:hypothetical protein